MGNKKVWAGILVLALVVAGSGIAYARWGGSDSGAKKPLVILADVERRTLQDTVTLTGTLARQELRKVTAVSQGRVSAVYSKDGSRARAGDRLFAIDGRDAIAEPGSVRFFRPLGVGDRGDDVLQLKRILAAAGDNPGPMDTVFTEQTRFALAQWQAQHHYPGATPVAPQSVTVSLAQGSGYTLGKQTAAGLIIGPGGARTTAARSGVVRDGTLLAFRGDVVALSTPALQIQSTNAVVSEGTPATFVITASEPSATDLTVNLNSGGTATSNDVVTPPASVTLPMNTTSVSVTVPTRVDQVVKPNKTIMLSLGSGTGYSIGSPNIARTTLINSNVPAMRIAGGGTITPGSAATLVVTADQAPVHDTQISVTLAGDAVPGTDYRTVNPVLRMRAGQTSARLTINTLTTPVIQPDHHIVASLTPVPTQYSVGAPGIAVVTIQGATGNAALPIVTLRAAATHLVKGQPYNVTLSLSQALSVPLTVVLAYGGNAAQGTDFTLPGGTLVVPPGQTALPVVIPTVVDKTVESDRVLIVAVAANSAYQIGSPNAAQVTIESEITPELTISSSTQRVSDGGAATFTIRADQAPVEDTSVNYQAVGTALPGQDFEPLLGTAILRAGQTQVSVVLRSIQKDVVFVPTDMIVGRWPIRVGQVFVKEGDPLPPGTAVMSLTDPNFTVTLQASASDRTKLKVGQHCTVTLAGGVNEQPGTISELDSNLTSLDAASPGGQQQQVYEGKIDVGDLGAADGASVTIKVIDQQETNAITVPIAAVKQNGTGVDVVRVIDLNNRGKVKEMPVETGLTEGSYIEIKKGLKGDETVIVEVDQPQ
ncbi:MAG TPA: Calx-beta domain-containing protein [Acidimicrobiia bacterium]|nr:Calx-beta domain-containing protein [Acidimicrobiia bacterium]